MANDFLEDGYSVPTAASSYVKLEAGETTLRILSKPVLGWSYWNLQNKPVRIKGAAKPNVDKAVIQKDQYGFQEPKHFWAMVVFDYKTNEIRVLEVTQPTIQKRIQELAQNPAWGSPFGYDIVINKVKAAKTSYTVTPNPPTPLNEFAKAAYKAKPCDLYKLFINQDPFGDVAPTPLPPVAPPVSATEDFVNTDANGNKTGDDLPF